MEMWIKAVIVDLKFGGGAVAAFPTYYQAIEFHKKLPEGCYAVRKVVRQKVQMEEEM